MSNWYIGRETLKAAAKIVGAAKHDKLDLIIEAASREAERDTRRFWIPKTQTRYFDWPPQGVRSRSYRLWLDQDLLSITSLKTKAQASSPTTISSSDYFLEPVNETPYNRIEIDLSSTAVFEPGDTWQRAIEVIGSWGYSNNTLSVGTVSSGLASDSAATSMVCSDASKIEVGHTLLIESEQIFVRERDFAALGSVLINDASVTAAHNNITITLDGSHGVVAGEIIRLDSELVYVVSVSTNILTVIRAWDGSILASHSDDTAVHINRTLTIERGGNGTTAATHANSTAISRYEPEKDITQLVLADSVSTWFQAESGFARTMNAGDTAVEIDGQALAKSRQRTIDRRSRTRSAAV